MTPQQHIAECLKNALESGGVDVPVQSLLLSALGGEAFESADSSVVISVALDEQPTANIPRYHFTVNAALVMAVDDDKTSRRFKENYNAVFAVFDSLISRWNASGLFNADGRDCPFMVETFKVANIGEPSFSENDMGGEWSAEFSATLTAQRPF